jgi:hypothetical protein
VGRGEGEDQIRSLTRTSYSTVEGGTTHLMATSYSRRSIAAYPPFHRREGDGARSRGRICGREAERTANKCQSIERERKETKLDG